MGSFPETYLDPKKCMKRCTVPSRYKLILVTLKQDTLEIEVTRMQVPRMKGQLKINKTYISSSSPSTILTLNASTTHLARKMVIIVIQSTLVISDTFGASFFVRNNGSP